MPDEHPDQLETRAMVIVRWLIERTLDDCETVLKIAGEQLSRIRVEDDE